MKGRVVSVANLKGGVGKTTTAVMLADGLSMREAAEGGRPNRVLVIDADPQASLGFALIGGRKVSQAADAHLSVNTLMNTALMHKKKVDVAEFIIGNISRVYGTVAGKVAKGDVSLIPSSPAMIFSEQMIIRDMTKRKYSYDQTLQHVFGFVEGDLLSYARRHYDWTIVDCAPGMNMLGRAAICASDATVVTTVPEPLATFGFDVFLSAVWAEKFDLLPAPRRPLVLLTRVTAGQQGHALELARIAATPTGWQIDARGPFGARAYDFRSAGETAEFAILMRDEGNWPLRFTARFMRQDFFTFLPSFKLQIIGNHKPGLRNVDDAARRRFNLVPFVHTPAKPDRQLEEKLKAEWPGILRWMIEGCLAWQRDGLVRPASVTKATAAYFADQDTFKTWLEEDCDVEPGNQWKSETSADLFAAWSRYAKAAGESAMTRKAFAERMQRAGFEIHRGAKGVRSYRGIKITAAARMQGLDEAA